MNLNEIKEKLQSEEYDFLRTDKHLGKDIMFLTLGGSYAYGTNNENSDLDIRGVAFNKKDEILLGRNFEQVIDNPTDTTIYSFTKFISLICNCNPNTIELLGGKPEHYFYIHPLGQELIDNTHLFLSQKAAQSFGGYATAQLRRLDNKAVRLADQEQRERHILNSIKNAYIIFPEKYEMFPNDAIKLYIDKSDNPEYDSEIFMDIVLHHYPLRDYKGMWSEMQNIVKDYSKIGKRNKHAVEHDKLGKHMMHLVRLYYMCFDILENEKVITYRDKEYDLLMSIRNGEYLDSNKQPIPEFYEMVDELEKRLKYDKENTSLPEEPDYKKINEFVMHVNEKIVRAETYGECYEDNKIIRYRYF